jgi:hypothetical protein
VRDDDREHREGLVDLRPALDPGKPAAFGPGPTRPLAHLPLLALGDGLRRLGQRGVGTIDVA